MAVQIERKKQLDELGKTQFDCLIVGGEPLEPGQRNDASLRGLNVAFN